MSVTVITPELAARIRKVAADNPELTRTALAERFHVSHGTIANILGPRAKPAPKPARPGPTCVAQCACGWNFTGPRDRVAYQRREHYRHHPAGAPRARTTISRAP